MGRWTNHKLWDKERLLAVLEDSSETKDEHKLWKKTKIKTGYGRIQIGFYKYLVHRVAAYIYWDINVKQEFPLVLHKQSCPYRNCWSRACLYLGDHSDNNKDAYQVGNRDPNRLRDQMRELQKGAVHDKHNTRR